MNLAYANRRFFADVTDHWVNEEGWFGAILKSGLMSGYDSEDGIQLCVFGSDDTATRGQVVTVLYRAAMGEGLVSNSYDATNNTTPFTDSSANTYYTQAVNWAYAKGIVTGDLDANGTSLGTFRPDDSISREELATLLHRYAHFVGIDNETSTSFATPPNADWNTVSTWAQEHVAWCYSKGIMTGTATESLLEPTRATTRAELAKMICVTMDIEPEVVG